MPPIVPGHRLLHTLAVRADHEVWAARPVAAADERASVAVTWWPEPPADGLARLRAQASDLARLGCSELLPVLGVEEVSSGLAVLAPIAEAGTLAHAVDVHGVLTPGEVLAVLGPVAVAAGALLAAGRPHGDLKPGNVLLRADGAPWLGDLLDPRPEHLRLATPAYLDPTVAHGRTVDGRAEVFSLAVTAYECLTGRRPHVGSDADVVAAAESAARRPLAACRSVPPAVAAVVEAGLDPDPACRPADPPAFVAALRAAAEQSGDAPGGPEAERALLEALVEPLGRLAAVPEPITVPVQGANPAPVEPRSPDPAQGRWAARGRRLAVGAVAAVLAMLVGSVLLVARAQRPVGVDGSGRSPDRAAQRVVACPAVSPPAPAPGRPVLADLDGDGCPEVVRWDGRSLALDRARTAARFRVRPVGAQVLAGDWDGDGVPTLAVYDPRGGRILYVDRVPISGSVVVRAARSADAPRHGRAVVAAARGRQVVRVEVPDRASSAPASGGTRARGR